MSLEHNHLAKKTAAAHAVLSWEGIQLTGRFTAASAITKSQPMKEMLSD